MITYCNVCKKNREMGEFPGYCKLHTKCEVCGSDQNLFLALQSQGGLMCQDCRNDYLEKRVSDYLAKDSDDRFGADSVICPWCGDPTDADTYSHDGNYQCSCCGKYFDLEIRVTYSYSTYRDEL